MVNVGKKEGKQIKRPTWILKFRGKKILKQSLTWTLLD